uniref:Uncharacterized protein n=1 Tax=Aplanochytrium stocchinoi TaxID=215587 RepID=A0A7S3LQJ9_9STRA|mmetsp:Transcript_22341/g.28588  ORF Transcript_22341/g.28588 Transcript_22341/m.28588 type:complete len:399 (-) Transcript_22341:150-1346(-)
MSGLWVNTWNRIANQSEIRVVNNTRFSFKVKLQVGGVTYLQALLPSANPAESKVNSHKLGYESRPDKGSLYSSVKLACGYFWYTVVAERSDTFDKSKESEKFECFLRGVFGGSTLVLNESNERSGRVVFEKTLPKQGPNQSTEVRLETEYTWTESDTQIRGLNERDSVEPEKDMLIISNSCLSSLGSIDIDADEKERRPSREESKDDIAECTDCLHIPTLRRNLSFRKSKELQETKTETMVMSLLNGLWVVDSDRSDNMETLLELKGISYFKRKAARHITQKQKIQPASRNADSRFQIKNIAGPVTETTEINIGGKPMTTKKGEKISANFVDAPVKLSSEVLPVCVEVKFTFPNGDKQTVFHGISKLDKNVKHMLIIFESIQAKRTEQVHIVSTRSEA